MPSQTGSHGNEFARNNRKTVDKGVFYEVRAKGLYNEEISLVVVS
jgi:hypothetical protein